MSSLAPTLLDSLLRLLPAPGRTRLDPAEQLALRQVVSALAAALERGELGLDLEGPAPPELEPQADGGSEASSRAAPGWPAAQLAALEACGWLVDANALENPRRPWCGPVAGCAGAAGTSS